MISTSVDFWCSLQHAHNCRKEVKNFDQLHRVQRNSVHVQRNSCRKDFSSKQETVRTHLVVK